MLDSLVDSDGEMASSSSSANCSSQSSSLSSGRSSLSRSSSGRLSSTSPSFQQYSYSSICPSAAPARSSTSSKPHRSSSDPAWAAVSRHPGPLGPRDFRLLRRLGAGDIGTVYLCRLRDIDEDASDGGAVKEVSKPPDTANPLLYAMKVVDRREVARKKKSGRADAERRVLRSLDHPFLPTLYADFDASPHFSCVVMEFCPGGDLHSLRHRQPGGRFSVAAARFYAAEVLVALEYLHLLGVVYRDLKPENVLIRGDGHIMLSDFDLSLQASACASVQSDCDDHDGVGELVQPVASKRCSSSMGCFPILRFFSRSKSSSSANKSAADRRRLLMGCSGSPRRFVAEPVDARSGSFVGTHEYVAPEVASGHHHGSAVDWWAFGIFLYELLHGRTPFAGTTNEATLRNIVKQPLAFPDDDPSRAGMAPMMDPHAKDLISRLLNKDPTKRLGSRHGAADVKAHPFFSGLNFALLRSQRPPVVPATAAARRSASGTPAAKGSRSHRQRAAKPGRFDFF